MKRREEGKLGRRMGIQIKDQFPGITSAGPLGSLYTDKLLGKYRGKGKYNFTQFISTSNLWLSLKTLLSACYQKGRNGEF